MAKLTIIGNPSPVVGKKEMYTISTINDYFQQIIPTQPLLNPQTPIHWGIFVQEKNTWRRTTDNKKGQAVPYTFGQKSLHFKAIKIVAQQGNESGELIIHPQQAKEPKITKVELLDANYLPLPKGKKISYQDTIIARAHCIEMYKRNVSFTLWEDDAKGEGHDPVINMMNKINPVPIMGIVDEYGVAEAVFRLPFYTMAVQIANARIAAGETDEGPTHEYYVTAEYVAKHIMKASPNVNVINPTHIPPTPPSKTSSNTPETKPSKPKPKADTPKFPITSSGKKQADPDAKILNAEFLNERAQPIEKAEVGDTVIIKITTQHMKGRNVTVRIWEEETGYKTHDKIYEKKWVLPGNENFIKVPITKRIYELGITPEDMATEKYDYKFQVYFIEVEPDNTHVTSQVIPITKSAKKLEVENSRSVAIIKKPKELVSNCGEKYCIKKGDKNELIREINIRLSGFGGNVPTNEFTANTEKMIKQFQRDYMKVPETGKVCGNVLKAIDEFCNKYIEQVNDYKCPCQNPNNSKEKEKAPKINRCPEGWEKGLYTNQSMDSKIRESQRKYEYPGMHRSTLWAVSAMKFYLDFSNSKYRKFDVNRGYRCWADNDFHNHRKSTNHFGKAADIRFTKNGIRTHDASDANAIRENIFKKYLNAKWWGNPNFFTLEKESDGAVTYVHVDCRDFELKYHDNKFFVKQQKDVKGKSILDFATELGFKNLCSCSGNLNTDDASKDDNDSRVDPKTLKTSEKGKDFIKDFEKFSTKLYNDDAKERNCTIGYGYLVHKGPCNGSEPEELKKGISKARALELFEDKIQKFEKAVQRDITVKLHQHEFDALVSLLFNTGAEFLNIGGVNGGETKIKKNINNSNYDGGADEFRDVTNDGLTGLVLRRKAEINMFKKNIYDSKH